MNQEFIQNALAGVVAEVVDTGLLVSLFTARQPDGLFGPTGAPSGNYADVPGLTDLACMAAPPSTGSIQATETRALEEITASELHDVWLPGWYSALDAGWRGENANGTGAWICRIQWMGEWFSYTIMGVESDSQTQTTRVKVKLATL